MDRRQFVTTTSVAALGVSLGLLASVEPAFAAPQNPQTISKGYPYPVYINGTGISQSMTQFVYVNQTQYTPAAAAAPRGLLLMGVGN